METAALGTTVVASIGMTKVTRCFSEVGLVFGIRYARNNENARLFKRLYVVRYSYAQYILKKQLNSSQ